MAVLCLVQQQKSSAFASSVSCWCPGLALLHAALRCSVAGFAAQAHQRESEQRPPDDHLCRSSPRHRMAYASTTSLSRSGRYCESSTLNECSTWQRRNRDKRDQRNEKNINRPVQGRGVAAGVTYNMITHKRMSDIWYSTAISIMNQYLSLPNGFMTVSQCPVHLYHLPLKSAIHQSKEKNCLTI